MNSLQLWFVLLIISLLVKRCKTYPLPVYWEEWSSEEFDVVEPVPVYAPANAGYPYYVPVVVDPLTGLLNTILYAVGFY
ncbi:unnamed protein product [Bursaphelenchus xylophilus]|uniref:(pine wood nematode) hypothetical protein n=1 Tax=Bursaphelenchus xylophilus TaxID=6326 RepID=A0A1I7RMS4_BURXY|nr:unnamed protein product [Bursaphelenchus xylophilus]CAG9125522.1 unnamed protein product [Bursaphelenchus xylophilus]